MSNSSKQRMKRLDLLLEWLFGPCEHDCCGTARPQQLRFRIGPVRERTSQMPPTNDSLVLTDSQKVTLTPIPVDALEQPSGQLAGPPSWSSTDLSIATVTPSSDGLSAVVETTGVIGACQINASGPISGTLDITVEAGDPVRLKLVPGTPESRL